MAGDTLKTIGVWAFIVGVVLALVVGAATGLKLIDQSIIGTISIVMVVLGLVVGALNVTEKEVANFIIAAIGLTTGSVALAGLGKLLAATQVTAPLGESIDIAFTVFGVFVASAVFIPALKAVYMLSKD